MDTQGVPSALLWQWKWLSCCLSFLMDVRQLIRFIHRSRMVPRNLCGFHWSCWVALRGGCEITLPEQFWGWLLVTVSLARHCRHPHTRGLGSLFFLNIFNFLTMPYGMRILVPQPGTKLKSSALQGEFLTIGPPWKFISFLSDKMRIRSQVGKLWLLGQTQLSLWSPPV